ncbi:cation transporter [Arcticibacter tournemirensis]
MDCPAEEHLIRMRLDGIKEIRYLDFDIKARRLDVYHLSNPLQISMAIESLKLNSELTKTEIVADTLVPATEQEDRKLLYQVLAINFFFFILEMITGFFANSMGLVADSLDMLADSIIYGLALLAIGATVARKNSIAKISGYFQLVLALLGFAEVIRRFLGYGEDVSFQMMIIVSLLALAGNGLSLTLLQRSKSKEAHMQASMIFTSNDVIANIGVIIAGVLVYLTGSNMPDLVAGTIVFAIVARGAFKILQLSKT